MIYIIVWLLCGLTTAYIYANKNRPWFWGALAGLILGPIGVILALLTPAAPPSKKCPYCGENAGWAARVCPTCGKDIHYA